MAAYQSQMERMVYKAFAKLGMFPQNVQAMYLSQNMSISASVQGSQREWQLELCTWTKLFPDEPFPGVCPAYEDLRVEKAKSEGLEARISQNIRVINTMSCLVDFGTMMPLLDRLEGEVKGMQEGKGTMTKGKLVEFETSLEKLKAKVSKTFVVIETLAETVHSTQLIEQKDLEISRLKAENLDMAKVKVINTQQATKITTLEEELRKLQANLSIERNNKEQANKSRDIQVQAIKKEKVEINEKLFQKKPASTASPSPLTPPAQPLPSVIIHGSVHGPFNVNSDGAALVSNTLATPKRKAASPPASGPPPRRQRPARPHAADFME